MAKSQAERGSRTVRWPHPTSKALYLQTCRPNRSHESMTPAMSLVDPAWTTGSDFGLPPSKRGLITTGGTIEQARTWASEQWATSRLATAVGEAAELMPERWTLEEHLPLPEAKETQRDTSGPQKNYNVPSWAVKHNILNLQKSPQQFHVRGNVHLVDIDGVTMFLITLPTCMRNRLGDPQPRRTKEPSQGEMGSQKRRDSTPLQRP